MPFGSLQKIPQPGHAVAFVYARIETPTYSGNKSRAFSRIIYPCIVGLSLCKVTFNIAATHGHGVVPLVSVRF